MKGKLTTYFTGVLTAVIMGVLTVSAFAADRAMTLTVSPIRVMVNGQEFHPRDAQGNDVYVFQSGGTTYVPLRALSEAYGLDVGYDANQNMATVSGTVKIGGDFASAWVVKEKPVTGYGNERVYTASYNGALGTQDFKNWWKSFEPQYRESCAEQIAGDAYAGGMLTMYFDYHGTMLGTVMVQGDYNRAIFRIADSWIK